MSDLELLEEQLRSEVLRLYKLTEVAETEKELLMLQLEWKVLENKALELIEDEMRKNRELGLPEELMLVKRKKLLTE